MRLLYVMVWPALVGGCGRVAEERWDAEVAEASCKTIRRCDPITFHRFYDNVDTCIEATVPDDHEGCRYDESAARACLDALGWSCTRLGRDYDTYVETCRTMVWDCGVTTTSDTGGTVVPPL